MKRLHPDKPITAASVLSYEWLNSVQEEVCQTIEKKLKLSEDLHQLEKSIQILIQGETLSLELTDLSGNPFLLEGLSLNQNEVLSFDLYLEVSLSNEERFSNCQPKTHSGLTDWDQAKSSDLSHVSNYRIKDLDTSSKNFDSISELLSLESCDESQVVFNEPRFLKPPNEVNYFFNTQRFFDQNVCLFPYQFSFGKKGFIRSQDRRTLRMDYLGFESQVKHWIKNEVPDFNEPPDFKKIKEDQKLMSQALVADQASMNAPPVILASDAKGQVHAFFNHFMYGDFLKIKMHVLNKKTVIV